ncbi:MAG: nucleotidyltransferase domain-containing protein [Candidatus Rokubacteria bacterium]|nr:nucleotidyltransferase domain-containing protein [Candidatus Rokubacteria bacterium]
MLDALRTALEAEPDVAFAIVFGSTARGRRRPDSDVDVAVELRDGAPRDVRALGRLVARLESAVGRTVDLVLLDEAPPGVAYRAFRDGQVVVEHDHATLVARKARVILEYLDFKPIEERCAQGVLRAAARGR